MVNFGTEIAKRALQIRAIKINPIHPFLWASGYYMPIYIDTRMYLSDSSFRKLIADSFAKVIEEKQIKFDIIAGTATAGIPHATTLADKLNQPLIYIRNKPKNHGLKNQIEGIDSDSDLEGKIVLIIEDLVSTGGSSLKAVQAVRNARGKVKNMLSIFNYGFKEAKEQFIEADCDLDSLLTYDVLLETAISEGAISKGMLEMLKKWHEDYLNWGDCHGYPKSEKKTF